MAFAGGIMKALKFMLPMFILMGGIVVSTTASYGKAEYTKKEKKPCATCHPNAKNYKELNKVGECYKDAKSLTNCADKK